MQLANNKFTIFKVTLFVLIIFVQKVYAVSKNKVNFLFNFYSQSGDEGDQIYSNSKKEDVSVIEPMLFIEHKIDATTSIDAHIVFDTWTAASDTELDGNTGASGKGIDRQSRVSGNVGYSKDLKTWEWSTKLGISNEFDYKSLNFGGSLEGRFAEDNFSLALSPQIYLDKTKGFDYQNEVVTESESRTIISLALTGSQLLGPSDIIQAGYTFINMNGNQNNISNSIKVLSNPYGNSYSRVEERMPGKRIRHALSTKWVHGFSDEMAFHLSYRYYTDDWNLDSNTIDTGLRMSFLDDDLFIMLTYRYYDQSKVKHWYNEVATPLAVMTSDSDLADFSAHRVGVNMSKYIGNKNYYGVEFDEWNFSSGLYYYTRSNNLNYLIVQAGISTEF